MKTTFFAAALAANSALAFPGMDKTLADIQSRQSGGGFSTEIIGDLATLPEKDLTPTGKNIKSILSGKGYPEDMYSFYLFTPAKDSAACKKDTCCIWKHIADDLKKAMVGSAGRCNSIARAAVRLGFHDAGAWSKATGGTGADGSIILADECKTRRDNTGLNEMCDQMQIWYDKYKGYGISMADLIQWAANVATVVCPLGPRIRSFVGRKDSTTPAVTGLLPTPFDSADKLISMFQAKTITPAGLIALLGAHTTSQQRFVDPSRAGDPQDTTPGVWDVAYYGQTLDLNAPKRIFKFESDINLANDPRTRPIFQAFTGPQGQVPWNRVSAPRFCPI
jgi:manganese peroxidase